METGKHISRQFDRELSIIKDQLVHMGGLIEESVALIASGVSTLKMENTEKFRDIESELNALEVSIDQECSRVLALRHPNASDLRFIIAASKIASELEGIGDELKKLVKNSQRIIDKDSEPELLYSVREVLGRVQKTLRTVLNAFARNSSKAALTVIEDDRELDLACKSALRVYVTRMVEEPRSINQNFEPIWMIRSLERIGKHARQCAMHIIYLAEGKDLRHSRLEQIKKELL